MVNDFVPNVVGVPLITPVDDDNTKPFGNVDFAPNDHTYPPDPPAATTDDEYGRPMIPAGKTNVDTTNFGNTAIENDFDATLPAASVTDTVTSPDTADSVGEPDTTPVDGANTTPSGKPPADTDHEYGVFPPLADNVTPYGVPISAAGTDAVVIANARVGAAPTEDTGNTEDNPTTKTPAAPTRATRRTHDTIKKSDDTTPRSTKSPTNTNETAGCGVPQDAAPSRSRSSTQIQPSKSTNS